MSMGLFPPLIHIDSILETFDPEAKQNNQWMGAVSDLKHSSGPWGFRLSLPGLWFRSSSALAAEPVIELGRIGVDHPLEFLTS
jgi:hypothetical protein